MRELNKSRRVPLAINAEYHFIDKNPNAVEFLRSELVKEGLLGEIGKTIFLHNLPFESAYDEISPRISARTRASVGRSIFVLDQKGYKDAPLATVSNILSSYKGAEVILTFAVDWLISYMADSPEFHRAVEPLGISPQLLRELLELNRQRGGRYLVQRKLREHLQAQANAACISPFFIRSSDANRDLWVVHLSNHYTARNVMVDTHWALRTNSIHPGYGGLEILGFDPRFDPNEVPQFSFVEHDELRMRDRLQEDVLQRIYNVHKTGVRYNDFLRSIVNETPARLSDLDNVIGSLISENELEIISPSGSVRRARKPDSEDEVRIPRQASIFSRLNQ